MKTPKDLINDNIAKINKLFEECEKIADDAGISFSFDRIYGMGGTYYPKKPLIYGKMGGTYYPKKPLTKDTAISLLKSGKPLTQTDKDNIIRAFKDDSDEDDSYAGWRSSSDNC